VAKSQGLKGKVTSKVCKKPRRECYAYSIENRGETSPWRCWSLITGGTFHLNSKVIQPRGILRHFRGNSDHRSLRGKMVFPQVLRRVEARAGSPRCKQEFRRRHSLIEASVLFRLIAGNAVMTL